MVVVGDARAIPLADKSVQTCVTSPPYYGLRDYGVDGQIGSENTLDAFLATMVGVMREVRRVLRDDGTVWLNMGDSFASSASAGDKQFGNPEFNENRPSRAATKTPARTLNGFPPKGQMLVPHRLAIALCDDGWIVRQDIVWAKPSPMPESVTDRPTTAHEFVFLLAKQPRYYYDAEAIREDAKPHNEGRMAAPKLGEHRLTTPYALQTRKQYAEIKGANKRSVWHIPSHPFPDVHFATFPPALVEPCILAGTPQKACPTCGAGWVRTFADAGADRRHRAFEGGHKTAVGSRLGKTDWGGGYYERAHVPDGLASACDCPDNDGSGKALVLDPFAGSGTTGVVARQMGRAFFGVELNPEYAAMANARIREQGLGMTRATQADGTVYEQQVMF